MEQITFSIVSYEDCREILTAYKMLIELKNRLANVKRSVMIPFKKRI